MLINVLMQRAVPAVDAVTLSAAFWGVLVPVSAVVLIAAAGWLLYQLFPQECRQKALAVRTRMASLLRRLWEKDAGLRKILNDTGFAYNPDQDCFYSTLDAWQSGYGYCRLYDEACAPLSMIVDCEPIRFDYAGKHWLIELWKGQYGMTTGCEIGVYDTTEPNIHVPGVFNEPFYQSAAYADQLYMAYTLKKKGQILFTREDRHWWLTGFKLGEFSEPAELSVEYRIRLKDVRMRDAFVQSLAGLGYTEGEYAVKDRIVTIYYTKPHSPQPVTRTPVTDWLTQRKNEALCKAYQELTERYEGMPEKLKAVRRADPKLYKEMLDMRKTSRMPEIYSTLTGSHNTK